MEDALGIYDTPVLGAGDDGIAEYIGCRISGNTRITKRIKL